MAVRHIAFALAALLAVTSAHREAGQLFPIDVPESGRPRCDHNKVFLVSRQAAKMPLIILGIPA